MRDAGEAKRVRADIEFVPSIDEFVPLAEHPLKNPR
jgi:hypothetical protein